MFDFVILKGWKMPKCLVILYLLKFESGSGWLTDLPTEKLSTKKFAILREPGNLNAFDLMKR